MINHVFFLLALYPLIFIIGRTISKYSEEEIKEIRPTATTITKIIITLGIFIVTKELLTITTAIILTIIVFIHMLIYEHDPQEKAMIAIIASLSIIQMIPVGIIISLIAILLKGINMHQIGEKILSKHVALQTSLFFLMISFKFVIIAIFSMNFL